VDFFLWPKPKRACRGEPLKIASTSRLAIAGLQCATIRSPRADPELKRRKVLRNALTRYLQPASVEPRPANVLPKTKPDQVGRTHVPLQTGDFAEGTRGRLGRIAIVPFVQRFGQNYRENPHKLADAGLRAMRDGNLGRAGDRSSTTVQFHMRGCWTAKDGAVPYCCGVRIDR
jgi:hypothetical protein